MAQKAPGKAHREGIPLPKLFRVFPDDDAAQAWLEEQRWGGEPWCPHCGSFNVRRNRHPSMPWRCAERECRKRFSVRVGTPLQGSHLGYQVWVIAIYLLTTSLKGQSSMKLHRDLDITQKTAWFLAHRIRNSFAAPGNGGFAGPVGVDETYMGGRRKNMSNARRKELAGTGRGAVGKTAVVGAKDRATKHVRAKLDMGVNAVDLERHARTRRFQGKLLCRADWPRAEGERQRCDQQGRAENTHGNPREAVPGARGATLRPG